MKRITLLFVLIGYWFSQIALGETIIVPTDYICIQDAIDNSVNGDIIQVLPGTYSGTGNNEIDFKGKEVILVATGGPNNTIIDCETLGRAFYIHSNENENTIINGFTIKNGKQASTEGGGIYCAWSRPSIINCVVENCSATRGGGMYFSNSSPKVSNCTIKSNNAQWGGGLECYYSSPNIENTQFIDNVANCFAALSITWFSHPVINNCLFMENNSSGTCGGIIDIYYNCNPEFNNCKILNNSGIGINITNYSNVNITNCIISNNTHDGLWTSNYNSSVYIRNTDILYNGGYGIYSGNTNFFIANTIIFGNSKEEIYLWSGNIPNISYSIVEGKSDGEIFGNINWIGENYDQYPEFIDPSNYNYELLKSSVCIDNGDPFTTIEPQEKDISGNDRIMGKFIDIGSCEYCWYLTEKTKNICLGDSIFLENKWRKNQGTFNDTLISQCGCDSVISVNLIVNNPSYHTISETACGIFTSPSGKYEWTLSGTYKDTIPNFLGCDSIITIDLNIVSIDNSVTQSEGILTANEANASYQWMVCNSQNIVNNATDRNYTPIASGLYLVRILKDGCESLSSCYSITITDLKEENNKNTIILFPNPVDENLNIDLGKTNNVIELEIIDTNGETILNEQFKNTALIPLNISHLKAGIYFVKIKGEKEVTILKFIKK